MTKSMPSSTAHESCSSYIARTTLEDASLFFGSYAQVLQMSPATSASPSRATSFAMRTACRFIASRSFSRPTSRSEEHTSELQSHSDLVCRLLLEKKKAGGQDLVAVLFYPL